MAGIEERNKKDEFLDWLKSIPYYPETDLRFNPRAFGLRGSFSWYFKNASIHVGFPFPDSHSQEGYKYSHDCDLNAIVLKEILARISVLDCPLYVFHDVAFGQLDEDVTLEKAAQRSFL